MVSTHLSREPAIDGIHIWCFSVISDIDSWCCTAICGIHALGIFALPSMSFPFAGIYISGVVKF